MMNLGWADIQRMSLWEYESRLYHWNQANGGGDDVQAPDPAKTQRLIDRINGDPRLHSRAA